MGIDIKYYEGKKKGVFEKIKSGAKKLKGKIENYQAQAPQRDAKRLEKLKQQEKELNIRAKIASQRARIQRLSPANNNPFGGGLFGAGISGPVVRQPSAPKKKRKKRSNDYVIINGKAYKKA